MRLRICVAAAATALTLTSCASDAPVTVNTNSSTTQSSTTSTGSSSSSTTESSTSSSEPSTSTSSSSSETSSSSTSQSPSSSAGSVPAGAEADSKGEFYVTKPSGWSKASVPNAQISLAIKADAQTDGVFTNLNVTSAPAASGQDVSAYTSAGATQMRQQGATVTPVADRKIGGEDAKGYLVERTYSGAKLTQTQYFVQKGSTVYIATMTSAASQKANADSTMNSILGSWTWTK